MLNQNDGDLSRFSYTIPLAGFNEKQEAKMMKRVIGVFTIAAALFAAVNAQSGGPYAIEKSVIAGGGGTSSGGTYSLQGTIGQTIAGGPSTNSPYSLQSGFWSADIAPTAAGVSISGRVMFSGRAVSGAIVVIALGDGTIRHARTNAFGNFNFDDILAGQTVLIDVQSRRHRFTPQLVSIDDTISGLELQLF